MYTYVEKNTLSYKVDEVKYKANGSKPDGDEVPAWAIIIASFFITVFAAIAVCGQCIRSDLISKCTEVETGYMSAMTSRDIYILREPYYPIARQTLYTYRWDFDDLGGYVIVEDSKDDLSDIPVLSIHYNPNDTTEAILDTSEFPSYVQIKSNLNLRLDSFKN